MSPAPTALPKLDAPYTLSGDARHDFERAGHVLLRRVAVPDEVAAYRPLIREATFGNSVEKRPSTSETRTAGLSSRSATSGRRSRRWLGSRSRAASGASPPNC
jgi:hypothetical protein